METIKIQVTSVNPTALSNVLMGLRRSDPALKTEENINNIAKELGYEVSIDEEQVYQFTDK